MSNKFIYFPSVSAGAFGNTVHRLYGMENKNGISSHGVDMKYWGDNYSEHKFPYMLVTAGHRLHTKDIRGEMGFQEDSILMGDSGGYQLATGAIKYTPDFKVKLLDWMEKNIDIGMNLDIPPRLSYAGQFDYCLQESVKNYKYFADNRTSDRLKLLNVIQGDDVESYNAWYQKIKDIKFDGWSIGGAQNNLYKFIMALHLLINTEKIHEKDSNLYLHYLGTSRISDILILMYVQKKFTDLGSNIVVTSDSSSPSLSAVYGRLAIDFSIKEMAFKSIKIPSYKTEREVLENMSNLTLPYSSGFNKYINPYFKYQDMIDCYTDDNLYVQEMNAILILHNIGLYVETVEKLRSVIDGGNYIWEQLLPKSLLNTFKIFDDLFAGMPLDNILSRHQNTIAKYLEQENNITESNNFWD